MDASARSGLGIETPANVVVFAPNLIGDAVMATPAFRALRGGFPQARMTLVVRSGVAPVLEGTPWFDDRLVYAPRSERRGERALGVIAGLRARRADLAVLFPNSVRSALMACLGGCRRRAGFDRGDRGWLLTDRLLPARGRNGRITPVPAVESYLALARHVGCAAISARTELATTSADEQAADRAWARLGIPGGAQVICLNNGGAFGPAKSWPNSYFAALARRIIRAYNAYVLILCGPAERESARAIEAEAAHRRIVSLAGEPLSIGLSKACVKRSALLISTDSGPRHFAAAFGVPEITLFGPTHIDWTRTEHDAARYLQIAVTCGPCQRPRCGELHHRCMHELTPSLVFAAVAEILEGELARSA